MPVVMLMHWAEVTKEQYEVVRKDVKWEANQPEGAMLHVSTFAADGMHVLDIWNTEADFNRFMEKGLRDAIQRAGIQGQPRVTFSPLHSVVVFPNLKPQ